MSESNYFRRKDEILQSIIEFQKEKGYFEKTNITINGLDKKNRGIEGLYLTVLGTSADSSDSGQVGRGNRVNRVISLMRPADAEAVQARILLVILVKSITRCAFIIADEIQKNMME